MTKQIPKILHYVWLGNEKPPEVRQNILSWKKHLGPDWKIKEWNESNWDIKKSGFTSYFYQKKLYAFCSDYIRLDVLRKHGGFYFDTDVVLHQNIPSQWLKYDLIATRTYATYSSMSTFGAQANNIVIKKNLELLNFIANKKIKYYGKKIISGDIHAFLLRKQIVYPQNTATFEDKKHNILMLAEKILQINIDAQNVAEHKHYANWQGKAQFLKASKYYLAKKDFLLNNDKQLIAHHEKQFAKKSKKIIALYEEYGQIELMKKAK